MRILYISPYAPARDGIADYTATLSAAMRQRGEDVAVIAVRRLPEAPPEVLAGLPQWGSGVAALLRQVDAWRPDIVHVQFAVAGFGMRALVLLKVLEGLRRRRATVVLTMHEVTRDTGSLGAPGRILYRRIAQLADVTVVHHHAAMSALTGPVGARPRHAAIIPLPRAELPAATTSPSALRARWGLGDAPLLLSFGFIHVDKGLDDLVQAFSRVSEDLRMPARVVVAGAVRPRHGIFKVFELRDIVHLRRVHRLVEAGGVGDRVVFTGYVDAGDVRPWFEATTAAVLPYRRIEDSAVANLAAAAGTPVIASTSGNLEAYVSDSRWTFPPGDISRLVRILEDFLGSRDGHAENPESATTTGGADLATVVEQTARLYADHEPEPIGSGAGA